MEPEPLPLSLLKSNRVGRATKPEIKKKLILNLDFS
jgi:hypothetical protein